MDGAVLRLSGNLLTIFTIQKIGICNTTKYSTWVSNSDNIIRNIFGNNATGTNNSIRTNFDARENNAISTEPYIISDGNGEGSFNFAVALYRVDRMLCGIK